LCHKRALNFGSRCVATRVKHPVTAVGGLLAQLELTAVDVEVGSLFDEPANCSRTLFHEFPDCSFVAKTSTGGHCVREMKLGIVVGADRCGEATLRVPGVAFAKRPFGREHDWHVFGQIQSERKPGNPSANDKDACLYSIRDVTVWMCFPGGC
jgi:hypothetical protein